VSCLAEQAKILFAEAEENNLDNKVQNEKWRRWDTCSLCEQGYHGVVRCALGWACWKTYLGRPQRDQTRCMAMMQLGNGISSAGYDEDALSVREATLSTLRRIGASEKPILDMQCNLASSYDKLGRLEEALPLRRDVYSGWVKMEGEEHRETLREANNYATSLSRLQRFEEAKTLLRKTIPVARRVHGDSNHLTLVVRLNYVAALQEDTGATLDDLRDAVTTLEEIEPIARRVLGGAHPTTVGIENNLRMARAALRACDVEPLRAAVEAMAPGDA